LFILLVVTHLKAAEGHLPCGITQCYLPPATQENALRLNPISHTSWYSICLPRKDRRLSVLHCISVTNCLTVLMTGDGETEDPMTRCQKTLDSIITDIIVHTGSSSTNTLRHHKQQQQQHPTDQHGDTPRTDSTARSTPQGTRHTLMIVGL